MKRLTEFVRITRDAAAHAVVAYFRPVVWLWRLIPRVLLRVLSPRRLTIEKQPIPEMVAELIGVIAKLNGHIARNFPDVAPIILPAAEVMEEAERREPRCVSEYLWAMSFLLKSLEATESKGTEKAREAHSARLLMSFASNGFAIRLKYI